VWNRLRNGPVQPKGSGFTQEKTHGENTKERAHDIAEEGLDKLVEGDTEAGEKLIDEAKKIDPKAVEELAEEVERDKENAKRFVNKG
jgi:predicted transcriptional regulator